MDQEKIKKGVRLILEGIGEDPDREGLVETPDRVARMYEEIYGGLTEDATGHLSRTFDVENDCQMILEKDITMYSTCEHHLLPFYGVVHIAYIPKERVVGLSKLARTVEVFARRPQVQERLTQQIRECIEDTLHPLGVMVVIEAKHMCMQMRGVEKQSSITMTSDFSGAFEQAKTRQELMNLINSNSHKF